MEKSKILNILDFYLDSMDDDIELIDAELENANINVEESEKRIMELLKTARAEEKIEKGRKLKLVFNNVKSQIEAKKDFESKNDEDLEYKMAARNISNLSEKDKKIVKKNLDILNLMEG